MTRQYLSNYDAPLKDCSDCHNYKTTRINM